MEEELAKARVYDDMEESDLGIGKDTEVVLPKMFEDNEVTLPKRPKGEANEKIKSRQSGHKMLYTEVKFQSAIYSSWSNVNDPQLGSSYQFCDTDPQKVSSQS